MAKKKADPVGLDAEKVAKVRGIAEATLALDYAELQYLAELVDEGDLCLKCMSKSCGGWCDYMTPMEFDCP